MTKHLVEINLSDAIYLDNDLFGSPWLHVADDVRRHGALIRVIAVRLSASSGADAGKSPDVVSHIDRFVQRYADEEAFRFNNREDKDADRFAAVMATVPSRRITYRQLCEIDGCGFMGLQ